METPSLSHMVKIYIHSQDELGISFCFCFLFPCFVGVFFLFKKNQISKEKKPHCTTLIYEKLKSTTVWEQYAGLTVLQHVLILHMRHWPKVQDYGQGGKSAQVIVNSWGICDPLLTNGPGWIIIMAHHHGPPLIPTLVPSLPFWVMPLSGHIKLKKCLDLNSEITLI
jgi:hypothetical protein